MFKPGKKGKSQLIGKLKLGLVIVIVCLLCVFSVNAAAQTKPAIPGLPNSFIVGVRDAAFPIAHEIEEPNNVEGFCGAFGLELKGELAHDIQYERIANQYQADGYDRFDGLRSGKVQIECGPNSKVISSGDQAVGRDIESSDTFYKTGIKLLLKANLAKKLEASPESLKNYKIGYVRYTATQKVLGEISDLKKDKVKTRDEALNKLKEDKQYIFASDALIIRTLLEERTEYRCCNTEGGTLQIERKPFKESDYTMYPSTKGHYIGYENVDENYVIDSPTEEYVMYIKKSTPYHASLMSAINNVLQKPELTEEAAKLGKYEDPSDTIPTWPLKWPLGEGYSGLLLAVFGAALGAYLQIQPQFLTQRGQGMFVSLLAVCSFTLGVILLISAH